MAKKTFTSTTSTSKKPTSRTKTKTPGRDAKGPRSKTKTGREDDRRRPQNKKESNNTMIYVFSSLSFFLVVIIMIVMMVSGGSSQKTVRVGSSSSKKSIPFGTQKKIYKELSRAYKTADTKAYKEYPVSNQDDLTAQRKKSRTRASYIKTLERNGETTIRKKYNITSKQLDNVLQKGVTQKWPE